MAEPAATGKPFQRLEDLYRLWDRWLGQQEPLACTPGCCRCCTRSLLVTESEAEYMRYRYPEAVAALLPAAARRHRQVPSLTTNGWARLCLEQQEETTEEDPEAADDRDHPCFFLDENGLCRVYDGRPLACRVMASRHPCHHSATLPAIHTTVATVFMQVAEAMDCRSWSNLFTFLTNDPTGPRRSCLPIPGLLLTPAESRDLEPLLADLAALLGPAVEKPGQHPESL